MDYARGAAADVPRPISTLLSECCLALGLALPSRESPGKETGSRCFMGTGMGSLRTPYPVRLFAADARAVQHM